MILRKIIKIVATRCQILRPKYTKFDFGRPRWGAYSAPPDPLAGFRGLLLREEGKEGRGRRGEGRGREKRRWEGRGGPPKLLLK